MYVSFLYICNITLLIIYFKKVLMIFKFKLLLTTTILLIFSNTESFSQKRIEIDTQSKNNFTINQKTDSDFTASFSIKNINFSDFTSKNENFTQINIDGFGKTYKNGEPDLPVFVKIISVPKSVKLNLEIKNFTDNTYNLIDIGIKNIIKPAVQSLSKSEDKNSVEYVTGKTYKKNRFTNSPIVELHEVGIMRNLHIYELRYNPVIYNPVQQKIIIRYNVNINISWSENSFDGSNWDFTASPIKQISHTKAKGIPSSNETFVIVSPAKYKTTLSPFVFWKKQQGYNVIEAYIGEEINSNNKTDIKNYLKNLYEHPAEGNNPLLYFVLVGDVVDIPAWNGTTKGHVTDLYYAEYTSDYLPEVLYGRISVETTEQLENIINKTLYVEKGAGGQNQYQNKHILVSGVDADNAPTYGNGAINYILKYYSNDNLGITPDYYLYGSGSPITSNSSQARADILNKYSDGRGIVYYTAHCSNQGWSNPKFNISDVSNLTNKDKYPFMINNCCQSYMFNTTCFGEKIVRAKDKGAVAYIGTTDYSYWDEDYFWALGLTSNIVSDPTYEDTDIGAYDAWFHLHNEAEEDRAYTVGQILHVGNMEVQSSPSALKKYYWEIYQIMGDPSLVPAKYQTQIITANYNEFLVAGQSNFTVNTKPYAVVTLSENGNIIASASTDANGVCNLNFDALENVGSDLIQIVVSLPDYSPLITKISVIAPDGPFLTFKNIILKNNLGEVVDTVCSGDTVYVYFKIINFGNETAQNTKIVINSDSQWLKEQISDYEVSIGNINSQSDTISVNSMLVYLADNTPNIEHITFTSKIIYNTDKQTDFNFEIIVKAPYIEYTNLEIDKTGIGDLDSIISPDESVTLDVYFTNTGMAQVTNTTVLFTSEVDTILSVLSPETTIGGFDTEEEKVSYVNVKSGSDIFPGTIVNLNYTIKAGNNSEYEFIGKVPVMMGKEPEYNIDNSTVEIINGYFYDTGGPDNNYGSSENYTMTFKPHNQEQALMVEFIDFDIESSSSYCYDKLKVYDGEDINSTLINEYCSINAPDKIYASNSSGALTFKFTSDNGINKRGWIAHIKSANTYKVTFNITDGSELLDAAIVEFVNKTDTAYAGIVTFNNVFSLEYKDYTVSKTGYISVTSSIGEICSDTTITVLLQEMPDICFTTIYNAKPLENVEIKFDGQIKYTDDDGKVFFNDVTSGSKIFLASLNGFVDTIGVVDITDHDICIYLPMREVPVYTLTFKVSDNDGFVQDAKITVDNSIKFTDENGKAVLIGLIAGNYGFKITKEGYENYNSNIEITDQNIVKEVTLIKSSGIGDISNSGFITIYPNPVKEKGELDINSSKTIDMVKIFNYTGKLLITKNVSSEKINVNLSDLSSGIYILQVTIGDNKYFEKVIIE